MDNQHRKISGYRELNEDEIEVMNLIKNEGEIIESIVDTVSEMNGVDPRWINIARNNLQQGLMALTRAVARPTTF